MIIKQKKMTYEDANLHIRKFRKDNHFAVIVELPERVEYFLSYHSSLSSAEKAFNKALNNKGFGDWRPTLLEFVEEFLANSKLKPPTDLIKRDLKALGLDPKAFLTDRLRSILKDRYKQFK